MSKWVSAAHVSSVFSFSVSAAVYCTSVGAVGLMSLSVCWRDRERKEHHCAPAHSLTATYRCSAVAMDTVPSLSPLSCLSVGMEGWGSKGEERSGSGCCLCVIFIPVQLRAPHHHHHHHPLPPLISPLPPPPASFLPSFPPSLLPSFSSSNLHTTRPPPPHPPTHLWLLSASAHHILPPSLSLCWPSLVSSAWLAWADFFARVW